MPGDDFETPSPKRLEPGIAAPAASSFTEEALALFDQAGFPEAPAGALCEPQRSTTPEALSISEGADEQGRPMASAAAFSEPQSSSNPEPQAAREGTHRQEARPEEGKGLPRPRLQATLARPAVRFVAVGTLALSLIGLASLGANHGRSAPSRPTPAEIAPAVEQASAPAMDGTTTPESERSASVPSPEFRGSADVVEQASVPEMDRNPNPETNIPALTGSLTFPDATNGAEQVHWPETDRSTSPESERSASVASPEFRGSADVVDQASTAPTDGNTSLGTKSPALIGSLSFPDAATSAEPVRAPDVDQNTASKPEGSASLVSPEFRGSSDVIEQAGAPALDTSTTSEAERSASASSPEYREAPVPAPAPPDLKHSTKAASELAIPNSHKRKSVKRKSSMSIGARRVGRPSRPAAVKHQAALPPPAANIGATDRWWPQVKLCTIVDGVLCGRN